MQNSAKNYHQVSIITNTILNVLEKDLFLFLRHRWNKQFLRTVNYTQYSIFLLGEILKINYNKEILKKYFKEKC